MSSYLRKCYFYMTSYMGYMSCSKSIKKAGGIIPDLAIVELFKQLHNRLPDKLYL